ncbi:eukaryotic translation initiation factor 6, variant 2 [Trifolium repens]|nr:eukaryotic translation initiation factor 6, variant 2 [Trifolium repens]
MIHFGFSSNSSFIFNRPSFNLQNHLQGCSWYCNKGYIVEHVFDTAAYNENSCEIGVFSKLTNAYRLVAIGGFENIYRYCLPISQIFHLKIQKDKGIPVQRCCTLKLAGMDYCGTTR